jgi:hypothetical protein
VKKPENKVEELCKAVVKAKDRDSFRNATDRLRTYLGAKPKSKRVQQSA